MKLVSWNVNGLRACLGKGFIESALGLEADVICLQETRMTRGQAEVELPGYQQFWNSAERKGYSGTAVFSRQAPLAEEYGLGIPEHDSEGRIVRLEFPEFHLVNVYTPNAGRDLARLGYRMSWDDAFRDYLLRLDAVKPVVICGDLNVAHREIDLRHPKANRGKAGFTDEEREKIGTLLEAGFCDTFRALYPDREGAYSWWSMRAGARKSNAGWRIDYFLVSERLRSRIVDAAIHSEVLGSDHCPVSLEVDFTV